MSLKFNEQQKRTIAKVITWRVALTTSHIVNAFIVTGSLVTGLQIAGHRCRFFSCLLDY